MYFFKLLSLQKFNPFLIIFQLFDLSCIHRSLINTWNSLANHAQINILFNHTPIVCSVRCLLAVVRAVSAVSWLCMNEYMCVSVWIQLFHVMINVCISHEIIKQTRSLTHSIIDWRRTRTPVCLCVRTNHRHCNVMRCALCDVWCVCNGITMYSHDDGYRVLCTSRFSVLYFVYLSLARLFALSPCSHCVSHTYTISRISITIAMERATETQTESTQNTQNPI